jgi:hypothetical protein
MAITFKFFSDAALTTPSTGITANQAFDGGSQDYTVYVGSAEVAGSRILQNNTNPGTNQIVCSIANDLSTPAAPATDVKLALTQGGLDSAVAGDPINLGATIQSGSANAIAVWVRIDDSQGVVEFYDNLSLSLGTVRESAV